MLVHDRAAAASAAGTLSKRAALMLDLVIDIKNNRKPRSNVDRSKFDPVVDGSGRRGAAGVLQPGLLKWLRGAGVDDVTLVNLSWSKLTAPDKKGEGGGGQREGLGPACCQECCCAQELAAVG